MRETEYLIIGAGIVGCATAYYLSKKRKEIIVVDKTYPCNEASGVNAGGLDLLQQPAKSLPLYKEAAYLWHEIQNKDGVNVGYQRSGGFYVILREEDLHILDSQVKDFKKYEIEVQKLNKKEFLKMAPWVSDKVLAANFCPLSGFCNPLIAGANMLEAAKERGVQFAEHQRITKIMPALGGGGYEAHSETEVFRAKKILVSCGIYSPRLLEPFGVHLKFETRYNMMTVTEKAPHFLNYTYTTPTLSLKQTAEGSLLIGGGREGYGNLETEQKDVSINNLSINVQEALTLIPSMKKLNILRSWSGIEGFSPDRLPHVGEAREYPGLYYSTSGYCGVTMGPALGLHTAKMMIDEESPLLFC